MFDGIYQTIVSVMFWLVLVLTVHVL